MPLARPAGVVNILPARLSAVAISTPFASRMLIRTLSHRSPSMMSLPALPVKVSLPAPPRRMSLPVCGSNTVVSGARAANGVASPPTVCPRSAAGVSFRSASSPSIRATFWDSSMLSVGGASMMPARPGPLARGTVRADKGVVVLPAGGRLDRVVAVAQDQGRLRRELRDAEVDHPVVRVALLDDPIEAEHPVVALDAGPLDHDVVAGLAVVVGIVALPIQDVVPDDDAVEEQLRVLTRETVEAFPALDPVVALVAHQAVAGAAAEDEVVAAPGEDLDRVRRVRDEVLAAAAEQDVEARPPEMASLPSPPRMNSSPNGSSMTSSPSPPKIWSDSIPP